MDTPDLMAAIAAHLDANKVALGLAGASYPALNYVPESPWAMVRQSPVMLSRIEKARLGKQVHRPVIEVVVLVTSDSKRPGDAARLDRIITLIADLFDETVVGNINNVFPDLDGSLNRVWNSMPPRRFAIDWGESGYCHGVAIPLDSEFTRKAVTP